MNYQGTSYTADVYVVYHIRHYTLFKVVYKFDISHVKPILTVFYCIYTIFVSCKQTFHSPFYSRS